MTAWTKDCIIETIQAYHRQGKPLTSIWREDRTVMRQAWKLFGSWHNALYTHVELEDQTAAIGALPGPPRGTEATGLMTDEA
jgi:hypothetical protein